MLKDFKFCQINLLKIVFYFKKSVSDRTGSSHPCRVLTFAAVVDDTGYVAECQCVPTADMDLCVLPFYYCLQV